MKQSQCKYCTNGVITTPPEIGHFLHVKKEMVNGKLEQKVLNLKANNQGKCPYCVADKY